MSTPQVGQMSFDEEEVIVTELVKETTQDPAPPPPSGLPQSNGHTQTVKADEIQLTLEKQPMEAEKTTDGVMDFHFGVDDDAVVNLSSGKQDSDEGEMILYWPDRLGDWRELDVCWIDWEVLTQLLCTILGSRTPVYTPCCTFFERGVSYHKKFFLGLFLCYDTHYTNACVSYNKNKTQTQSVLCEVKFGVTLPVLYIYYIYISSFISQIIDISFWLCGTANFTKDVSATCRE